MVLYLPNKFDMNEWTTLVLIILNISVFVLLPKRIPREITPLIVLLSISFPKIIDHTMAVDPFNLYDLTDTKNYELFDLLLYGAYPAFGYLFVYLLDYYHFKGFKLVVYFLSWTFFAVVLEFLLVKLHVFVFTGWNVAYSLPVYSVVLSLTFLFYKFIICYHEKQNLETDK